MFDPRSTHRRVVCTNRKKKHGHTHTRTMRYGTVCDKGKRESFYDFPVYMRGIGFFKKVNTISILKDCVYLEGIPKSYIYHDSRK